MKTSKAVTVIEAKIHGLQSVAQQAESELRAAQELEVAKEILEGAGSRQRTC